MRWQPSEWQLTIDEGKLFVELNFILKTCKNNMLTFFIIVAFCWKFSNRLTVNLNLQLFCNQLFATVVSAIAALFVFNDAAPRRSLIVCNILNWAISLPTAFGGVVRCCSAHLKNLTCAMFLMTFFVSEDWLHKWLNNTCRVKSERLFDVKLWPLVAKTLSSQVIESVAVGWLNCNKSEELVVVVSCCHSRSSEGKTYNCFK